MEKAEAKREICALMHTWRNQECPDVPRERLSSTQFRIWLEKNSPGHMRFKSPITGVTYDIDMWFDNEFNIPGR
jgi:hypothetical protein